MAQKTSIAVSLVAIAALFGCASDGSEESAERARNAVEQCAGHGGVAAIEDDAVICADETFNEERGSRAVEACRGHGGVSAFDDDIVICGDETFETVKEQ
jgi:hypothetical protein